MKKLCALVVAVAITMQATLPAYAEEPKVKRVLTTAYTEGVGGTGHITASGTEVREGIIATNRKYLGCAAYIWLDSVDEETGEHKPGEFVGIFSCEDTGGKGVQNGVIDVYRSDYDRCVEWMEDTNGHIWIQIVKGVG